MNKHRKLNTYVCLLHCACVRAKAYINYLIVYKAHILDKIHDWTSNHPIPFWILKVKNNTNTKTDTTTTILITPKCVLCLTCRLSIQDLVVSLAYTNVCVYEQKFPCLVPFVNVPYFIACFCLHPDKNSHAFCFQPHIRKWILFLFIFNT